MMICSFLRQCITIIAFQTTYGTKFSSIKVSDVIRGKGGRLGKLEFIGLAKYLRKTDVLLLVSIGILKKLQILVCKL